MYEYKTRTAWIVEGREEGWGEVMGHKKERRGDGEVNKRDIDQEGCEGGGGGAKKEKRGGERSVGLKVPNDGVSAHDKVVVYHA